MEPQKNKQPKQSWQEKNANQNYNGVPPYTAQNSHHCKNLQITNARESVEKKEPSYIVGRNVNWYSHYGEQYEGSLKN